MRAGIVGIGVFTAAAVAFSVWAFFEQNATGENAVLRELPKVTWQFFLVALVGGVLTYLLNRHRDQISEREQTKRDERATEESNQRDRLAQDEAARRQRLAREEVLNEFRKEMMRRIVHVTNAVRKAPLLISARRSYRTYDEQMRAVIDAYLELRAIRHEIEHLGPGRENTAFSWWPVIEPWMRTMERYLDDLVKEFASEDSKTISEFQRQAEEDRSLQPEVWERL